MIPGQTITSPEPGAPSARTLLMRGNLLRELRIKAGLTREALALRSKGPDAVSVATLKRAERGQAIYASTAASIARLLGEPLEGLLERTPQSLTGRGGPKTAIGVLPFTPIAGGEAAQFFAEGLIEDLIQRLGRQWFPVISPSFVVRKAETDLRAIGSNLGADYLVRGSVRVDGGQLRVTANLVDVESGLQVWSNWYDDAYRDVLALQERLTADIVGQVSGEILDREAKRTSQRELLSLDAWELSLRGLWHFHRSSPDHHRKARDFMQAARQLDASLALAYFVPILTLQHDLLNQWARDVAASHGEMWALATQFESACPQHPLMHVGCAYACISRGAREEAVQRLEEALDLDPNSALAHGLYGQALAMHAQADQGLHELDLARKLGPRDPRSWTVLLTTSLAHFAAGRYTEAVHWGELAVRNRPELPFNYAALAAAHAQSGDLVAARAITQRASARGQLHLPAMSALFAAADREIVERFLEGLRCAGYSG